MKKLILLLTIILSFTSIINAQNYMYVGDNQYPSTDKWEFRINGNSIGMHLEVAIGKDGSNGLVMLQTEVLRTDCYIGGNVYIFLSDGSRITCTDKNIRDHVDNKSIAVYKLTSTEVNRMKTNNITQIRFTILPLIYDHFNGTKTADNKIGFSQNQYETDNAITELFKIR